MAPGKQGARRARVCAGLVGLIWGLAAMVAPAAAQADLESWHYLVEKLVADGVPRAEVVAAFSDARVAAFSGLEFKPDPPRERRSIYGGFLKPASLKAARRCRATHAAEFESAAARYGVAADVLAAVLFIESGCGRNSGNSLVLHRLARLAMANEPANLRRNFERFRDRQGRLDVAVETRLRGRARYLEDTFYPEVKAVFSVAARLDLHPLELRGSVAGAFGYPQFLPTSYLSYGVDADADGRVSLYDIGDAAASCARYLAAYGWHPGATSKEKRAAIWGYNHSNAYIDAVLGLAQRLSSPPARQAAKPKPKAKPKTGRQVARREP